MLLVELHSKDIELRGEKDNCTVCSYRRFLYFSNRQMTTHYKIMFSLFIGEFVDKEYFRNIHESIVCPFVSDLVSGAGGEGEVPV